MTYEKYMKYKTKYLKLKELEKELIASGKLQPTLTGGSGSKMCQNCYKMHSSINKFCKLCNKNNIFKISKLTNTPTRMNIHGGDYELHNALLEKLQPIQENEQVGTKSQNEQLLKDDTQIGGNMCQNCYKIHDSKKLFCKSCNKNNIFQISNLTDTPNRIDLNGGNNHNELLEKLQNSGDNHNELYNDNHNELQEGYELYNDNHNELQEGDSDVLSTESSPVNTIFEKTNLKDLSLKTQLMNMPETLSELNDSESIALSIFDS
jgi:RNA polymerase subunit RPABC4/transcription elongation factor Spt4